MLLVPYCVQDWLTQRNLDRNFLTKLIQNATAVEHYQMWLAGGGQAEPTQPPAAAGGSDEQEGAANGDEEDGRDQEFGDDAAEDNDRAVSSAAEIASGGAAGTSSSPAAAEQTHGSAEGASVAQTAAAAAAADADATVSQGKPGVKLHRVLDRELLLLQQQGYMVHEVYAPPPASATGQALVGCCCRVFWPDDNEW